MQAERLPSFQAGALIAELKHFTSFVALLLIGLGGWKTAAAMDDGEPDDASPPVIVMKSDPESGPAKS